MYGNIFNYVEMHGNLSMTNIDESNKYEYFSNKQLGFELQTYCKGLTWVSPDKKKGNITILYNSGRIFPALLGWLKGSVTAHLGF